MSGTTPRTTAGTAAGTTAGTTPAITRLHRTAVWGCLPWFMAAGAVHANGEDLARVVSSTPIVAQVAVPRQVCTEQPVTVRPQTSGAGAVMGAIAGGAMGNAIGDGSGRAAATLIGIVGGALIGDRIEGTGASEVRYVQQCSTQTFYENRTTGYQVVYEYAGRQYSVQMPNDPGTHVRLRITPVGQWNSDGTGGQTPHAVVTQPQVVASTSYVVPQAVPQALPAPAVVHRPAQVVSPVVTIVPWVSVAPVRPHPHHPRPHFRGYGHAHGPLHGHWR